jgi:hypothetical protein
VPLWLLRSTRRCQSNHPAPLGPNTCHRSVDCTPTSSCCSLLTDVDHTSTSQRAITVGIRHMQALMRTVHAARLHQVCCHGQPTRVHTCGLRLDAVFASHSTRISIGLDHVHDRRQLPCTLASFSVDQNLQHSCMLLAHCHATNELIEGFQSPC